MPEVEAVTVRARANTSEAEEGMGRLHRKIKEAGEAGAGGRAGILGFIGAFSAVEIAKSGVEFLTDQLKESVRAGEEAQRTDALLANALQQTGNASQQTQEGLEELAHKLSGVTTASAETVKGVEQIAVRAKIPKGLFDDTIKSSIDLSAALGIAAPQAANILTKALQNPANAAGLLRREHIALTLEQEKAIKADVAHGNSLGAQTIILDAVKKAYGGAAEAVGNTFAGKLQIMQNRLDETKEKIGQALLPVLGKLLDIINPIIGALGGALAGAFSQVGGGIDALSPILGLVSQTLQQVWGDAQELADAFTTALAPGIKAITNVFSGFGKGDANSVAIVFGNIQTAIGRVGIAIFPLVTALGTTLSGVIKTAIPIVEQLAQTFVSKVLPVILNVAGFVTGTLVPAFITLAKWIVSNLLPVVEQIAVFFVTKVLPVFIQVEGFVVSRLIPIFKAMVGVFITDILPILTSLVATFRANVLPALESLWQQIATKVIPTLENLWNKISPILIPALQFIGGLLKNTLVPAFQLVGWIIGNVVVPAISLAINIVVGIINVFATLIGWIVQVGVWFINLQTKIGGAIGGAAGVIGTFIGNVIGWFQQLPGKIFQAGVDMVNGFINGIKSLAGNVGKALGDMIHNAVNNLPGGAQLAHLAGIPGFAAGTQAAPGGVAVVGEGGEPELVVGPHYAALPKGAGVFPLSQLGGGGGQPVVVRVTIQAPDLYLDGDNLTRNVLRRTPNIVAQATGMRGTS